METIPLICYANQQTGFYKIGTFIHTATHASLNQLRIVKTCNLRNQISSEYVLSHNFYLILFVSVI